MKKQYGERTAGHSNPSTYSDDADEPRLAVTGSHSAGVIQHDDLGRPRWSWMTELDPSTKDLDTATLLQMLDTSALSVADEPGAATATPRRGKETGYDPYDTMRVRTGSPKRRR